METVERSELTNPIKIGHGMYGEVKKYDWQKRKQVVAVKRLFEKSTKKHSEFDIMSQLDHPNIVKVFGIIRDSPTLEIVTEYVDGGSFTKMIKQGEYNFKNCYWWMHQFASALEHLHEKGIVHRDLKPDNLLLDQENQKLKVGDFGVSRIVDTSKSLSTTAGTLLYMAPEMINPGIHSNSKKYDQRVDIYSWASIFNEFLTRESPYAGYEFSAQSFIFAVGRGKLYPEFDSDLFEISVSRNNLKRLERLLNYCWDIDYADRPFAPRILEMMNEWNLDD